ncbi:hypothetical protein RFI_35753, partial [Reticulomyxa filosa]
MSADINMSKSIETIDIENKECVKLIYHKNEMIFFIGTQIHEKNETLMKHLKKYHETLTKYSEVIYERYGWHPDITKRIDIDIHSYLIGFVINKDENPNANEENVKEHDELIRIKSQIVLFDCNEPFGQQKNLKKKEVALVVFPNFQRQHLATDMVRVTWN